jgi:hypothetical protein
MKRCFVLAIVALFALAWLGFAADPPPLSVAEGKVTKVEKDSISFQPRAEKGKFGKSITLKITGTSNLSSASYQERAGKAVLVQREIKASDLKDNQLIAVIYSSTPKGDSVLLAAVAQPAEK